MRLLVFSVGDILSEEECNPFNWFLPARGGGRLLPELLLIKRGSPFAFLALAFDYDFFYGPPCTTDTTVGIFSKEGYFGIPIVRLDLGVILFYGLVKLDILAESLAEILFSISSQSSGVDCLRPSRFSVSCKPSLLMLTSSGPIVLT